MNVSEIKKEIIMYSKLSYDRNLVASAGGNVSMRRDGRFFITASGSSLRDLTQDDILEVDENGAVIGDNHCHKPSKEVFLHLCVYKMKPDVTSIIHVHPVYTVAYTVAGRTFPLITAASGQKIVEMAYAGFELPGTPELKHNIEKALAAAPEHVKVIVMERHGILSYGKDLCSCFDIAELVEETAKVNFLSDMLKLSK